MTDGRPRLPQTQPEIKMIARGVNDALATSLILLGVTTPPDEIEAALAGVEAKIRRKMRDCFSEVGADEATAERLVGVIFTTAENLRTATRILIDRPPEGSA